MRDYNAPHEVRDHEKLASMVADLEAGHDLPPVLVCGDSAFTGSHRLAAWKAMEIEPEVVELEDSEYIEIMEKLGLDPIYDSVYDFEVFEEVAIEMGLI